MTDIKWAIKLPLVFSIYHAGIVSLVLLLQTSGVTTRLGTPPLLLLEFPVIPAALVVVALASGTRVPVVVFDSAVFLSTLALWVLYGILIGYLTDRVKASGPKAVKLSLVVVFSVIALLLAASQ